MSFSRIQLRNISLDMLSSQKVKSFIDDLEKKADFKAENTFKFSKDQNVILLEETLNINYIITRFPTYKVINFIEKIEEACIMFVIGLSCEVHMLQYDIRKIDIEKLIYYLMDEFNNIIVIVKDINKIRYHVSHIFNQLEGNWKGRELLDE